MTKNETRLIVRRARVTNTVGFTSVTKRASYRCWILSGALATVLSVAAWAQTQLATVSGTITEPSGAVAADFNITIVNQGTRFPLGDNAHAVFKDAAGNFAANAGQILTTAGTARQIQLAGRLTF